MSTWCYMVTSDKSTHLDTVRILDRISHTAYCRPTTSYLHALQYQYHSRSLRCGDVKGYTAHSNGTVIARRCGTRSRRTVKERACIICGLHRICLWLSHVSDRTLLEIYNEPITMSRWHSSSGAAVLCCSSIGWGDCDLVNPPSFVTVPAPSLIDSTDLTAWSPAILLFSMMILSMMTMGCIRRWNAIAFICSFATTGILSHNIAIHARGLVNNPNRNPSNEVTMIHELLLHRECRYAHGMLHVCNIGLCVL